MKTSNSKVYWSASDVERYAYCPLNFLLSVRGYKVESIKGIEYQDKIYNKVRHGLEKKKRLETHKRYFFLLYIIATLLVASAIPSLFIDRKILSLIILVGSLASLLTGSIFYFLVSVFKRLRNDKRMDDVILYFSIAALILLLIFYLFYSMKSGLFISLILLADVVILINSYYYLNIIKESKILSVNEIDPRKVLYLEDKNDPVLVSDKWRLRGTPDIIIEEDDQLIPIEIKSSGKPKNLPFSHMMQLISYAVLIEENYGREVKTGILNYPNGSYKIEITEHHKTLLKNILNEMDHIIETGEAHRNHNNQGKCAGCYRKSICPESLSK